MKGKLVLTAEDKLKVEDALIETLVCAINAPVHVRPTITDMAIGLADLLDDESVERCKQYAKYRTKGESK